MKATATPTFDVFVSHSSGDREFAADVAERLRAEGLQPFDGANIPLGQEISQVIWDALAECHAFIVIVSANTTPDAMGMVELGAATAWNKPIFVLLNGPASTRLPEALGSYQVYPRNRLDEVLTQIRRNLEPLSDDDRTALAETYRDLAIPADRLSQSPRALQQLTETFNGRTRKQLSGTRLFSELLRMRKQAKLPRLSTKRRGTKT
ncbi:MAG: toll/interleukin-1 receptor domain-containing protein [Planctomycetaceae bacterium]|nr:toll/interleukin-1 receptor domain-containing protein [Planctomycetaceae bacterium]MCA9085562.1 toll/interleukin-1 receptor domain-containing protein [Planctomycetaceae bacterium]